MHAFNGILEFRFWLAHDLPEFKVTWWFRLLMPQMLRIWPLTGKSGYIRKLVKSIILEYTWLGCVE